MDSKFMNLLKELAKPTSDLTTENLNTKIIALFPEKEFLVDQKRSKAYFQKLVSFMLGKLHKNLIEDALILLDTIYKRIYDNLSTLDNVFSKQIRVPIIERFGRNSEMHKLSKKLAKLSYKDKGEVIKDAKNSLIERHAEVVRYDSKEIFTLINNVVDTENVYEKAVGLALASGCRPIELFDKAVQFQAMDNNWVIQNFVAKKRGEIVPVSKPIVGLDSKVFIEQIEDMRYFISTETRNVISKKGELNKTIESRANDKAKELFGFQLGITLYSCRKIYSDISYLLFAKNSIFGVDPTIALWRSKVLAHGPNDINTQNHYSNFKSIDNVISPMEINELSAKVDRLERLVSNKTVIEVQKPVILGVQEAKKADYFRKVKEMFDSRDSPPTQTEMEGLLAGKVPRAWIRLWFKENK